MKYLLIIFLLVGCEDKRHQQHEKWKECYDAYVEAHRKDWKAYVDWTGACQEYRHYKDIKDTDMQNRYIIIMDSLSNIMYNLSQETWKIGLSCDSIYPY